MKNSVAAVLLIFLLLGLALVRMLSSTTSSQVEPLDNDAKEAPVQPATVASAAAGTSSPPSGMRGPQPDLLPDPESLEAAKAARIAQLENQVISEPVSASWAAENARRIKSFLQANNLQAAHLPAVDQAGVNCRTTICRIELRTQDSLAAGELTQGILQTISEQMPTAQIFETDGSDGTTLLIFSTAAATTQGAAFRPKR
ncbi:hypothetical protein [Lysobacter solisilvae (ex Woo and Kim 2020)]|uniref:Uncharacterized protein n=1 Tax=Agrilutibacter terrestris TaxID=2865112 RepID=A0A7H0FZG0_9GAMM|nr:hypothetical protein [Lysobacter terrestris]QNP41426.1 hypothetical protein H8B22_04165 [Lysobacter terrestris]